MHEQAEDISFLDRIFVGAINCRTESITDAESMRRACFVERNYLIKSEINFLFSKYRIPIKNESNGIDRIV